MTVKHDDDSIVEIVSDYITKNFEDYKWKLISIDDAHSQMARLAKVALWVEPSEVDKIVATANPKEREGIRIFLSEDFRTTFTIVNGQIVDVKTDGFLFT